MAPNVRYVVALVLGAALGVMTTGWAISESQDRPGLQVEDLLLVESPPDPAASRLDDQLSFAFEIFGGERRWTEEEYEARFSSGFKDLVPFPVMNPQLDTILAEDGKLTFVAMADRSPDAIRAIAVTERGTPGVVTIALAPEGGMTMLGLDPLPSSPRLRGWETALALAAGWLFLAAGFVSERSGGRRHEWALLVGATIAFCMVLVLAQSQLVYTVGRVAPAAAVVVGAWLLIDDAARRSTPWLWVTIGAAAVVGLVAPLTRDATIVGHPAVVGQLSDSDALYRVSLTFSAALVGIAMAMVAAVDYRRAQELSRWERPPRLAATVTAALWAGGALGSALDYAFGDGTLAGGPLGAVVWVAFAAVPVVVAFELVSSRWESPALASLVIDLEAEGGELQPAVATALRDPSIQVVISEDGETLLTAEGEEIAADRLPAGRALTQIRSKGTLVGGLVHEAALRRDAERLEAVAAAAGLALDVSRLNRQVVTQLEDVTASRARIVQASDAARRRVERDLHDGAQQQLVGLGLTLQRARRRSAAVGDEQTGALLDAAADDLRAIIDDIRSVSRGSHPALLAERGLEPAIDALAERAPVPVRIDVAAAPLPDETATTIYYVVAEALTNVAKHAEATSVSVSICQSNGSARVEVCDDGRGGAAVSPGSGLQGLDDRVAAAGGSFRVHTGPAGTRLEATLPCR